MAHTCPECFQVCHCNGDIDDMVLDWPKYQDKCVHYKQCELENEEENYDPRTPDEM